MRALSRRQTLSRRAAIAMAVVVLGVVLVTSPLRAAGQSAVPSGVLASALASGPPYWLPVASMHTRRNDLAAALGIDGRIYALGGANNSDGDLASVEAYSVVTNTWSGAPPLLTARGAHIAAPGADGRLYMIGETTEAYQPGEGPWTPVASPPLVDGDAAVAGPDGRIYVLGGGSGDVYADVQVYSPRTNRWSSVAPMPTARRDLGAATGFDGRIYALGGNAAPDGQVPLRVAEAYTPRTNRWTPVAALPVARVGLAAATGADGRIYAIGGLNPDPNAAYDKLAIVDAYDPRTNRWSRVARLRTPRTGLAAVRGADGRLYALGGVTDVTPPNAPVTNAVWLNSMEAYGPSIHLIPPAAGITSTVTLTGANFAARATVSVTWGATSSGQVLATGRTNRAGALLHPLRIHVPRGVRPGRYAVRAMDDRSRYPVITWLAVGVPLSWTPPQTPRPLPTMTPVAPTPSPSPAPTVLPTSVHATHLTFTVTSAADAHEAHPGAGVCGSAAGHCTLRAAIEEANLQPRGSSSTIRVPAGRYVLTLGALVIT